MGSAARSGWSRRVRMAVVLVATAAALLAPSAAEAQIGIFGRLANFLVPGGYFFTSNGARDTLNDSLWYHEADVFRFGVGVGVAGASLSIKAINASSQFTPFTGATQYSLFGPSIQAWTARVRGIRPYASVGYFAAQVKSPATGTTDWALTPSASAGFQYSFTRVTTLSAEYRVSRKVGGINTDGVALRLMLF